jgi:hypothetical protein
MRLEFHPEAEMELIETAEYYELQVPVWVSASRLKFGAQRIYCSSIPISALRQTPISASLS